MSETDQSKPVSYNSTTTVRGYISQIRKSTGTGTIITIVTLKYTEGVHLMAKDVDFKVWETLRDDKTPIKARVTLHHRPWNVSKVRAEGELLTYSILDTASFSETIDKAREELSKNK